MSTPAQRSFAAGEISPAVQAHTDMVKYQTGARTARNGRVMRHGGFESRPGFKFITQVMNTSNALPAIDRDQPVRLVRYILDGSTSYVLEFGHLYMRVIKNGALIPGVAKAITGITQAAPGIFTSVAHGLVTGDQVLIDDVEGMTQVNGLTFYARRISADTFRVSVSSATAVGISTVAYGAYTGGGTVTRVAYASPFTAEMMPLLKYEQETSAAFMTLISGGSLEVAGTFPYQLVRTSDTNWLITAIDFKPGIDAPSNVANTSFAAGTEAAWVITAVKSETFEESVASDEITSATHPAAGQENTLTWDAVVGAAHYKVYRANNGIFGYYATVVAPTFTDVRSDVLSDLTQTPPLNYVPFPNVDSGPATVAHIQGRQCFANNWFRADAGTDSTTVWASKTGAFKNFSKSSVTRADDSLRFPVPGRHEIRHLLDLKRLVIFSSTGEFVAEGDTAGILLPTAINVKQESANGASTLAPLVINSTALYVQARGSVVRSFGRVNEFQGYSGDEISIFAAHLVKGHTINDWCYQQTPHSSVLAVREDGVLLSITYVPEQQIIGWSRFDTRGTFENAVSVPEGTEDAVYVVVNRNIGGVAVRYIERATRRDMTNATIKDCVAMDSAFTYDGRNTDTDFTMTISAGVDWTKSETLSIKASEPYFDADSVGKAIHFEDAGGVPLRITITEIAGDDVAFGKPHRTVPAELRDTATSTWALAIKTVTGITHLEGEEVAVFADGFVVANPINSTYGSPKTVTGGEITLSKAFAVIHVGLPFIVDLETLDIDTAQGDSLVTRKKNITSVVVHLDDSRGIWVGPKAPTDDDADPIENMTELKLRESETMEQPISLFSGKKEIEIQSEWNSNGRIFMRQIDPVPVTILAVVPDVAV